MPVNKWHKPLVVNNHNMNITEIKKKFALNEKKQKKNVGTVIVDSVKVSLNEFPDKYK